MVSEGLERVDDVDDDRREVDGEGRRHVGEENQDERKEDDETDDFQAGEEVYDAGTVVEPAFEDGDGRGSGGNRRSGIRHCFGEDEPPSLHEDQEGHVEKQEIPREKGDVHEFLSGDGSVDAHGLERAGEDDGIAIDHEQVGYGGTGSHGNYRL